MLTAEQRELRRDRLGSSDTPAILGVDGYRNAHDVYVEKVFEVKDLDRDVVRLGNLFEAPLIAWAAEELGLGDVEVNVSLVHAGGVLGANLDAYSAAGRCNIEAKMTRVDDEWGSEGTDEVPERVIAQALHQVECCDSVGRDVDCTWVPALVLGTPKLYRVPRSESLQRTIVGYGHAFWKTHVVPRRPPEGLLPSADILKRIRRVPKSTAQVDPALVLAFEQAQATRKAAEDAEDEAQRALLTALGDAEAADFGDPRQVYTYFEQSRAGVDVKRLRLLQPAIFAAYDSTSYFRVLRRSKRRW